MVNRLIKNGLVEKVQNPINQKHSLSLTPKGQKVLKQTEEITKELETKQYQGFSEEEKEAFRKSLCKIRKNLEPNNSKQDKEV